MVGGNKWDLVEKVLELLDVQPGESVLEVGFGPGVGIRLAEQRVGSSGSVAGVDPSEIMLEMATRRNSEAIERGTVELALGSVERLPFGAERFDKAFAMNSMQIWPDAEAGLKEIRRVLKDGGRLVLSFDGPARKGLTADGVVSSLEATGFRQVVAHDIASTLYVVGER